jgi:CheY-like chemotaxis protein
VLTDIGMPEVSGYDIVRHIKKSNGPHIPVLAITGLRDNSFQSRLFDAVIEKPFNLKKLERILQSLQNVEGSNGPVAPDIRKS